MAEKQNSVNPVQQNAMARQMLMQTALPIRKKIGTFTGFGLGETARIRLLNAGLTTGIQIRVSATVDIDGTVPVVPSSFGPYPLVQQVVLTDYNQIERVNTDAFSLQALRSIKRKRIDDLAGVSRLFPDNDADPTFSSFPVPAGSATDQEISFFLDVPFAVDAMNGDLRGMNLSQSVVGEQFVNLKFADQFISADPAEAPYTAGTSVALDGNITVEVWQEYLQPQNMQSLPLLDLSTVYEIKGLFRSSSDITSNGEKLINYPNVRTVFSSLHLCVADDGAMTAAELPTIKLLANSSQILREHSYASKKREVYDEVLGELASPMIYMSHRAFPISTAIFGNVQLGLVFGTIPAGNNYILSQFESVYASGTPLPGISTQ